MQEDTSADVQLDDDIADLPLFGQPEAAEPTTEAPSETVEQAETKGTDTEEATDSDKATDEAKDTEATAEDEAKADDSEATESTEDKGKPDPAAAYRAYQERQQRKQAIEQTIDQTYAPKSQDELYQENIDQGMEEQQAAYKAEVQALREEMLYNQQRTQIAELNAGMQAEAVNALNDFPIFNDKSPDYDKEFADKVQASYQRDARLQVDENGIILRTEIPLYDYYKEKVDDYNRGLERGRTQRERDNLDMLSRTEEVGGSSTGSKGPETLEEMGERLADVPLF